MLGLFNLIIQESERYTNATQLPKSHLHFSQDHRTFTKDALSREAESVLADGA